MSFFFLTLQSSETTEGSYRHLHLLILTFKWSLLLVSQGCLVFKYDSRSEYFLKDGQWISYMRSYLIWHLDAEEPNSLFCKWISCLPTLRAIVVGTSCTQNFELLSQFK